MKERRQWVPRAFQPACMEFIQERSLPGCALWAPPGMGKTSTSLTALDTMYLASVMTRPTLVVAPLRVATDVWSDDAAKWRHLSDIVVSPIVGTEAERIYALRKDASVYTTNYEQIPWLIDRLGDRWPFGMVIADECFTGGTQVQVPDGARAIADVRVGDLVSSHLGPRRVTRIYKTKVSCFNLVLLRLSNGTSIHVTKDHPLFTDLGWLPAGVCRDRKLFSSDQLSDMRQSVRTGTDPSAGASTEGARSVLLALLSHERHFPHSPGIETAGIGPDACNSGGSTAVERRGPVAGDAPSQGVGAGQGCRSAPPSPGRQRDGVEPGRSASRGMSPADVYVELLRTVGPEAARLSMWLQSRFWRSPTETGIGGGWRLSPYSNGPTTRLQKDDEITVVGVEDYPDQERGSVRSVFNLEVEGAHTYFAGGVLVHNCTKLKGFRLKQGGKRAQALSRVRSITERWLNLTGTPSPNGLQDLWGQTWFLDRGKRLGMSYNAFLQRWFYKPPKGGQFAKLKAHDYAERQIQDILRPICMSLDPADWFDLEEPVSTVIKVKLPPAARRIYDEFEKTMFAEFADGDELEVFNAAALTNKCLQLANGAAYLGSAAGAADVEKIDTTSYKVVHDAKLEALESIAEETSVPLLVAYNFKSDKDRILKAFPDAVFLGDKKGLARFKAGNASMGVGHDASVGHGIDGLQDVTNVLVRFGHTWNLENRLQMADRIGPVRQAQSGHKRPLLTYDLVAESTIDETVLARHASKREVQDLLMQAMNMRRTPPAEDLTL